MPWGAGISIPEWEEEAPEVGDFLLPKYELILVYPGIGQTKPFGLIDIISDVSILGKLEELTGIKKIEINKISKITTKIKDFK